MDAVTHADGGAEFEIKTREAVGDTDTAVGETLGVPPATEAVDVAELDARAEAVKE